MALKSFSLSIPPSRRPIDPLEIFNKLTLRGSIKNIWETQAEALREWSKIRNDNDVVVEMGTGGGKTLVGLLIAQSLVNETQGRVVYVCATNQLVEQTAKRAAAVSLSVATRFKSGWENREQFEVGESFCITNYAVLFNGKSIFRDDPPTAIVFDDAHVAEGAIRGHFTLRYPMKTDLAKKILALFRKHFANSSQATTFQDVSEGRGLSTLFVPMFLVWQHAEMIRKMLLEAGVEKDQENLFAWEHLKDHLAHCTLLADGSKLEFSPPIVPVWTFDWFGTDVRRVYLTATLPTPAAFLRTFGVSNPGVVQPKGRSGDPQRLFVFADGESDTKQRNSTQSLVAGYKCCVIAPSLAAAAQWSPPARVYDTSGGDAEIERFARSSATEMLALAARYDGIDLPGDACRVLVLDRLPKGEHLLDRFVDEGIQAETIRLAQVSTRIVQAIGRIFRSSTDHGVVVLVGPKLQSWLRKPATRSHMPKLLQQQILLGIELTRKVTEGDTSWKDLIDGVLDGDKVWDAMYERYIDRFDASEKTHSADWLMVVLVEERGAYQALWEGQIAAAVESYDKLSITASVHDPRLEAWYHHWCGAALLAADRRPDALAQFTLAANTRSELGRPPQSSLFSPPRASEIGQQAKRLADGLKKRRASMNADLRLIEADLVYGPATTKAEEAMKRLGDLLGLISSRPDKSCETGPDVYWRVGSGEVEWGLELKTDKDVDGEYTKNKDIAQSHDHEQWLTKQSRGRYEIAIVGRPLRVAMQANPSPKLRVIPLEGFRDLANRVRLLFESVDGSGASRLEQQIQDWLVYYGLIYPGCVESLESHRAEDLVGME